MKAVIYIANVDEASLSDPSANPYISEAKAVAEEQGAELVLLCAQMEAEMVGLSPEEQREYLALAGVETSGLEQVIQRGYALLGLISYFSFNEEEAHAWTIRRGWTAPQAAGVIHSDFERGFIRAEVIPYDVFAEYGNRAAVRSAGQMRVEGQDYQVQDGDVILFRFNV